MKNSNLSALEYVLKFFPASPGRISYVLQAPYEGGHDIDSYLRDQ